MRTKTLLLLPFTIVWALAKLLFWPAAVLGLFWWLAPHSWAVAATWAVVAYMALVLWFWRKLLRGRVHSMTRGTVAVRRKAGR